MKSFLFKTFLLVLIVPLLAAGSCSGQSSATSSDKPKSSKTKTGKQQGAMSTTNEKYVAIAKSKYRNKLEFIKNEAGTYVLCTSSVEPTAMRPEKPVEFFVYDLKADKIVYESNVWNGSVEWDGNTKLRITTIPGMVRQDYEPGDNTVVYDLTTGKTTPLNAKKGDKQ